MTINQFYSIDGQLTETVEAGIVDVQRFPITNSFARWLDEYRQIATDIIHHKKENANSRRSHTQRDDFYQNCKNYAEPHFS